MPIEITPYPPPVQLDVQMVPIFVPGEFTVTRFIVFTKPAADIGEWSMRCRVRNMGSTPGSGTIHVTGELHRIQGAHIVPIDEIHEFSIAAWATHEYRLEDSPFPHCQPFDQCWLQLETSWGESTRPFWFRAGYYETGGIASMTAYNIEADKVSLRLARGGHESYRWEFSIRTPRTGTAEQLIEDVIQNPSNDSWSSCYFYGKGLLSQRDYKAYGYAGSRYAETYFTTK